MKKVLAIVGATGIVGQTVIKVFIEEKLDKDFNIILFSSENSAGGELLISGENYSLNLLDKNFVNFKIDFAIFCTDETVSRMWVPKFIQNGITVIDNSSAFRMVENIPLVVPEINFNDVKCKDKLISNPNCSTIQLAIVIDALKKKNVIKKVIVSTYQSVSGAGKVALDDYFNGTANYFKSGINGNLIQFIGSFDDKGFCGEENKISNELNKILHDDFEVFATTVRVPIPFCHGESVYVEFENCINIDEIIDNIKCDGVVFDKDNKFLPQDVVGTNLVYVSRLRKCDDKSIMFFEIADNLRRGAAYNAISILKKLQRKI